MSKPIAVLISDIHFDLNTLSIASMALKSALDKAAELDVPTVIAGDLHNTKDIIRGKVANGLISLLKQAKTPTYILVGNHDLLNEKGVDHGLNYLAPYSTIVDEMYLLVTSQGNLTLLPYQNSQEAFNHRISLVPKGSIIIMHQGFLGAQMGDYVQDKTSIDVTHVKDFRVYSGHYHRYQTLGTVTYLGSPYTITFGEANDGPKGFLILNDDGTHTRELLPLRKHVILEMKVNEKGLFRVDNTIESVVPGDLVWMKVYGPQSLLKKLNKKEIGLNLFEHSNFKLDLIPDEVEAELKIVQQNVPNDVLLDSIIDNLSETDAQKAYLKQLWRELV